MTVFDESGKSDDVACPVCHASMGDCCEHLLAFADITFWGGPSGVVSEYVDDMRKADLTIFTEKLSCEQPVTFDDWYVEEMWKAFLEEGLSESGQHRLPSRPFQDFVFELLERAGGDEIPSSLLMESGGRCSSAFRIMFARTPAEVVGEASRLLPECFAEKKPRKRPWQ